MMIYHVKPVIVLIQLGTNLWLNPQQIVGIKTIALNKYETCIITPSNYCIESDWTVQQIQKAIGEGQK